MKDFLAGMLIALGAFAYLTVGGPIGALLFSFGIICIVKLQIKLYTGVAGTDIKFVDKLSVLGKNIVGGMIMSILLIYVSNEQILNTVETICTNKCNSTIWVTFVKAFMCGAIVDISVFLSKKYDNVIPLLLGIPLFILCGFNHSIADVTYLVMGANENVTSGMLAKYYTTCVIGNYVGCNLRRFCFWEKLNK